MIGLTLLLSLFVIASDACRSTSKTTCMTVFNNCTYPIYPGLLGSTLIANGGFKLNPKESRDLEVPADWEAARIWARTGCNETTWQCDTGSCGNALECNGRGGEPPASLAEFTLAGYAQQDFYDISLVDGFNLPIAVDVVPGTYNATAGSGDYYCKRAGGCVKDLDDPSICPPELQMKNAAGKVVACKSACLAFDTDEYCCRFAHGNPNTCQSTTWPVNYPAIFKDACPNAYSYAYDDRSSTYTCHGLGTPSPSYIVRFC